MLDKLKGSILVAVFVGLTFLYYLEDALLLPGSIPPENVGTISALGFSIFRLDQGYVIPFEILGVLLLAAMIGAIIIAREDVP